MIQWDDKYSTGVEEIDHQHKWIFEFANSLEQQLNEKKQLVDIEHLLESLRDYTKKHFHYEEKCMNKWKCPLAEKNKCSHDQFLFAYNNFMERYEREGHSEDLAWKIHDMVEKWIVSHICQIDVHIKECVRKEL